MNVDYMNYTDINDTSGENIQSINILYFTYTLT